MPSASQSSKQTERRILERVEPEVPPMAAKMFLSGTVRIKVWISPQGLVSRSECIGGPPLLIESALTAVKKWKFEPAAKESAQIVDVKF
jgi:TonB family protein